MIDEETAAEIADIIADAAPLPLLDSAIKQAIITAVKFEDACFRYFEETTAEYWQRCLHAVARARKDYPGFLESTYQQATNDVAYYYK